MSEQLNSCQDTQYSGWKEDNKKTTKLDVQLNSTRLTQATVFHNLCRDQHKISAKRIIIVRGADLSDFFSLILVCEMCVFCFTSNENCHVSSEKR